jgi:hypothetical protein
MVEEDTGPTRQSRRERVPTTKAAEQKKMGTTIGREWEDSDEDSMGDVIEAQMDVPKAPRPARRQYQLGTPSQPAKRGRPKGSGATKNDPLATILAIIEELKTSNMELKAAMGDLMEELAEVKTQLEETRDQLTKTNEQLETTKAQLLIISTTTSNLSESINGGSTPRTEDSTGRSPSSSYASVLARAKDPVVPAAPAPPSAILYCTIDTSRVEGNENERHPGAIRQSVESEMRTTEGHKGWRCMAVTKDPKNSTRVRIACRDETELQQVKEAAQRAVVAGARVLRDQLYPIKVDNANRTAILDNEGSLISGAVEMLGKENDAKIAKVAWLSNKNLAKAYGSMVVYLTSSSDATRLLQGQYFHVGGESAYTNVFEQRARPKQCYKCQELGHMAFSCQKTQVCSKCAGEEHHHSNCRSEIPKCVLCGGPHESTSKNCRALYPRRHE